MQPRTRRVQRIHLPQPLVARLGATQVILIDISTLGARVEHHTPLNAGAFSQISFRWDDQEIVADCRIARSRLERFSTGANGLTIYHSGLEFEEMSEVTRARLKRMIESFITRALEEQKLNARGVMPLHDASQMPIFRFGGQLTANTKDVRAAVGSSVLPTARMTAQSGYVSYYLDNQNWRKKRLKSIRRPNCSVRHTRNRTSRDGA
jgi:PilZ domain